jgi:hypothetical protein
LTLSKLLNILGNCELQEKKEATDETSFERRANF